MSEEKKSHLHLELAELMEEEYGFVRVNGEIPAMLIGDQWHTGWDNVHACMLAERPDIPPSKHRDAIDVLRFTAPTEQVADPRYIAFSNGILDIRTMKKVGAPEGVILSTVPHKYDPKAKPCQTVEMLLDGISGGDAGTRANLEECMGLALSRYTGDFNRVFWLFGEGENGKSTFAKAVSWMVGEENTVSQMPEQAASRFGTQRLNGPLLWIADDVPEKCMDKRGKAGNHTKRIVTGEKLQGEAKLEPPYEFAPVCTPIFTSNGEPVLPDYTRGSTRRFHPIQVKTSFSKGTKDPYLMDKIRTEEAAEWMILLAVKGLCRVLANEGPTETETSKRLLNEALARTDPVAAFIADEGAETILSIALVEPLFKRFRNYAYKQGLPKCERHEFTRKVNALLGTTTHQVRITKKAKARATEAGATTNELSNLDERGQVFVMEER